MRVSVTTSLSRLRASGLVRGRRADEPVEAWDTPACLVVIVVEPVDLVLQDAYFFGEPDSMQDQLAQDIQGHVITVVTQAATGLQIADQPDQLGTTRAVRVIVVKDASDGDSWARGAEPALARISQSIAGRRHRRGAQLGGAGAPGKHGEHLDRTDAGQHRRGICRLAGSYEFDGYLSQLPRNVLDQVPHNDAA